MVFWTRFFPVIFANLKRLLTSPYLTYYSGVSHFGVVFYRYVYGF
jgi:hypothetical protein